MDTDKPLSDDLIQCISNELLGIAENGGGHFQVVLPQQTKLG